MWNLGFSVRENEQQPKNNQFLNFLLVLEILEELLHNTLGLDYVKVMKLGLREFNCHFVTHVAVKWCCQGFILVFQRLHQSSFILPFPCLKKTWWPISHEL